MLVNQGYLSKMQIELNADNIAQYYLVLDSKPIILLNNYLNKKIILKFLDHLACVYCDRNIKKTYNQGYCFVCFRKLARCDYCIVHPEKCHFAANTCREPSWGEQHCMQKHIVYLAKTSGLKIGITRQTQIPTRWLDQGAVQALPIYAVTQRYYAGLLEVIIKQHVADKTNWRKMLQLQPPDLNLLALEKNLFTKITTEFNELINKYGDNNFIRLFDQKTTVINYPVLKYPEKIKSYNLEKLGTIEDILIGIKGQYLLFKNGVINIRKYTGYKISISIK